MMKLLKFDLRQFSNIKLNMEQLKTIRKEYSQLGLKEEEMPKDPMAQFQVWLDQAVESGI